MGDIRHIRTDEGWLQLAVMPDLYRRHVVGWQMGNRFDRHWVWDAPQAAAISRGNPYGLMVHSYPSVHYVSADYRQRITNHQSVQSMGRRYGNLNQMNPMAFEALQTGSN